jgi:transaldolase
MNLFLDTADIEQIREARRWGILDGVTTNPTHVAKTGKAARQHYIDICKLLDDLPVSLETIATSAEEIIREGRELAKIAPNVVVKVPILREGLVAVKRLSQEGIKTNVTVTFSPLQALLAAKCGATYVSPFVGRLDAVGHDGMALVRQIKTIYDNYRFPTQIIVAATRHPLHMLEAAMIGAHVCTMNFELMKQMYDHPLTDVAVDLFLKDWAKVPTQ